VLKRVSRVNVPSSYSWTALRLNPSLRGRKPVTHWPSCSEAAVLMHSAVTSSFRCGIALLRHVTVKVKCTVVQALRLCTGCTAHRGSRGIGKVKGAPLYRH
jgi:hypothetical protein